MGVWRGRGRAATLVFAVLSLLLTEGSAAPREGVGRSLCGVAHPSDRRIVWRCERLEAGESLESRFGEQWEAVARFNRVDRRHARPGTAIKVPRNVADLIGFTPLPPAYAPAEGERRFLLVDLDEQFLGGYEYGRLRFVMPVTTGLEAFPTPVGTFRLTAAHRMRPSSLYPREGTDDPYPMTYALRFHINREGIGYWMHGRDLPGRAASHGCIGLYDEAMQRRFYGVPAQPVLEDAKQLYDWVLDGGEDRGALIFLPDGPTVQIVSQARSLRGVETLSDPDTACGPYPVVLGLRCGGDS